MNVRLAHAKTSQNFCGCQVYVNVNKLLHLSYKYFLFISFTTLWY
jgi:hypothetical protein